METLNQTEAPTTTVLTRKHLKGKLRDIELRSLNLQLPSIKNTKKFLNLSTITDSPKSKQANSVSPTRFPSIFKKYYQF